MASRSAVFSVGCGFAASTVPWNTSEARRKPWGWLPPPSVKPLNPDGSWNRAWYLFFKEMAEYKMGGIHGQSVAQVATTVSQTQAQVLDNTTYTDQLVQYARSVAATAEAVKQVAQDNGLSGASSIPPPSTPPTKPTSGNNAL